MPKGQASTISKLPQPQDEAEGTRVGDGSGLDVDKALSLLRKGGRSKRAGVDEEPQEKRLSLRISDELAERVRTAARARPVKTSSHSWIVEAVLDKLKKESF